MSELAKLKKKAAELDQKKQYDKAIIVYQQMVEEQGDGEDVDVGLPNRVGDMLHREGRTREAVDYWERAVDMYATRGFITNAIAIGRKIVRFSSTSVEIQRRLGQMAAQNGFRSDAKKHFLLYAGEMQRIGKLDAAFAALKEFAELCPDQDDVRLELADQLTRHGRGAEALEQLDALHARYLRAGRQAEADAARERMRAIDPDFQPHAPTDAAESDADSLILFGEERRSPSAGGRGRSSKAPGQDADLILIGPDAGLATPPAAAPDRSTPARPPVAGLEFGREFEAPPAGADEGAPTRAVDAALDEQGTDAGTDANVDVTAVSLDGFEPTAAAAPASNAASDPAFGDTDLIDGSFTLDDAAPAHPATDATGATDESELPALELTTSAFDDTDEFGSDPFDGTTATSDTGDALVFESGSGYREDREDGSAAPSPQLDPAAELAAEARRRPETPTVLDALGVGHESADDGGNADDAHAADDEPSSDPLADLPLMDASLPFGAPGLPPLDDDAEFHDDLHDTSDGAGDAHWSPSGSVATPSGAGRPPVWRRVSDAMLAAGDREGALRELDSVLQGFESTGDMVAASAVIDEIVRIAPSVRNHERRTDIAYRGEDRPRLREAYAALLDALESTGERVRAAGIRTQIAELDAIDGRAAAPAPVVPAQRPAASSDSFVNLGDLLRDDEPERTTRMVVEEQAPSGDEQADFAEMLEKFKRGLAENVDAEDFESHHDLGVAFREMGLLDEAISEFQQALRGTRFRVRTLEALGQCFVEKEQYSLAAAVLQRAVQEVGAEDDQLVGVLYLLGVSLDAIGRRDEAVKLYERVLAVDYQFRDAADRVATAGRGAG